VSAPPPDINGQGIYAMSRVCGFEPTDALRKALFPACEEEIAPSPPRTSTSSRPGCPDGLRKIMRRIRHIAED